MAFTDITPQFREIVSRSAVPNAKRRKVTKGTQKPSETKDDVQALLNREYVQEAYNIVSRLLSSWYLRSLSFCSSNTLRA